MFGLCWLFAFGVALDLRLHLVAFVIVLVYCFVLFIVCFGVLGCCLWLFDSVDSCCLGCDLLFRLLVLFWLLYRYCAVCLL